MRRKSSRLRVSRFLTMKANMRKHLARVLLISALVGLFLPNARAENDIGDLINEGISLYRQRRYIEAREALEKAVSAAKEPDVYYLLGNTYYMLGQTTKSKDAYRDTLELDPQYMPALQNLGRLLYKEKKYKECIGVFDRVLAKDVTDIDAIRFQAGCYHALNETSMATQKFLQVHRLDPDDSETIRILARLYKNSWDYSKAIPFYEKLISIEPDEPRHHLSLSMAYYKLGENEQALDILQRGHKHIPEDYDIASRLGDMLFLDKNYSEAVAIYRKALLIRPESKDVPVCLAKIYSVQKELNSLRSQLECWNAGMLECWTRSEACAHIGLSGMKTIRKMILFGLLSPTFHHSNIPLFHVRGKNPGLGNLLYFQ